MSDTVLDARLIADYDDWTEEAIRKRAKQIRDWALERWHIDSSDLPLEEAEELLPEDTEDEVE